MSVKTYSKAQDGGQLLSANFKVSEFACRDGSDQVLISDELVTLLQKIRDHFGVPVVINSAYRTQAYNAKVGGAARSQHLLGTAADITLAGVTPLKVAQYAEFLQPKAGGIGVYRTFTHVDVRAARSRWDSRSGKETVVSGWPGNSETSEAEEAVVWATAQGILRGDGGDLMLDQPLTRRQAAMVLHRLARLLGKA
ncbi:D-Ala-D-Ala carboxypeptidase family metallohydrolase [uncultured Oscillibacter sp.]|uniref:YcbK family protein n=1 Tax=uncultured Oscillibacter sp. TaxID=876091 RepID=UPI0025DB8AE6|nr:D-Ala-D-Ala carboxypeptidase family metallohydrolase [uncultured Oscillibacter sp.]